MPHEENKTISSILKRLDRIEAEISRIKEILLPSLEKIPPSGDGFPSSKSTEEFELEFKESFGKLEKEVPVKLGPKKSLENVIGTKWIGRVGMVAIIFAVAFFLKYSFENRLIGETGRIILGILCGLSLIGVGEHFQKKKNWGLYGQTLTGGGLAILFFDLCRICLLSSPLTDSCIHCFRRYHHYRDNLINKIFCDFNYFHWNSRWFSHTDHALYRRKQTHQSIFIYSITRYWNAHSSIF